MAKANQENLWGKVSDAICKEWQQVRSACNLNESQAVEEPDLFPPISEEEIERGREEYEYNIRFAYATTEGFLYLVQIKEVRLIPHGYRCYKLNKLIYYGQETMIEDDETHWLFYHASRFQDLHADDKVLIKVSGVDRLRNWQDLSNSRNIYISELYLISDMKR